jgi:predicted unusual protein kinase regulating ubiquinone biosynthesis (AarF/ABC1/UbiB family)
MHKKSFLRAAFSRTFMDSDFSAARLLLEQASQHLQGTDDFSAKTCQALDLIIEALAAEQYRRPVRSATVLAFPGCTGKSRRSLRHE